MRFGHADHNLVDGMDRYNSVSGLDKFQPSSKGANFEHFIRGKMTRLSLKHRSHKVIGPLIVSCADVCCPITTESLGGAQYFCSFSDAYSRYKRIEMIRRKSEAQKSFIIFSVYF